MIWAFVDYENVGSLEGLSLSHYERVFVFCGPKNPRIKLGAPPIDGFCRVELIGVTTVGRNNLDFHLAFHLGRFHEIADKSVAFHIISADGDFNGLVNHLRKIGRNCKKVAIKSASPSSDVPSALSETASLVVSRLRLLDGRTRPRKREGLINWIKSQCNGKQNKVLPEAVCNELVKAKFTHEDGTDISYKIER